MATTSPSADELAHFVATVREFCVKRFPDPALARPGVIRDASAARTRWRELAIEVGVAGLLVPEEFDGIGASAIEAGRIAEALSAELATVPYLASGVLAPTLLAGLAPEGAREDVTRLLTEIASGEVIATVAWADDDPGAARSVLQIEGEGNHATVTGSFHFVIDADLADVILLVGSGGTQVAIVRAEDLTITPRASFDLTRVLGDVVADRAPAALHTAADPSAFEAMLAIGRLVLASECAGGAQAALARSVDYARQRVQFGREIGSFQAIKHILADCYVASESALSVARLATEAHVSDSDDAARLIALASFYCPDRFAEVAAAGIQVHGGIGFTAECTAHLYRRRAESARHLLGAPSTFRADFLAAMIDKENAR